MLPLNNVLLSLLVLLGLACATAPVEVLFLIAGQETPQQRQLSRNLKQDLIKQSAALLPDYTIHVHVLHEIFKSPGQWTLLSVLPHLVASKAIRILSDNTRWIVFCEDTTRVVLPALLERLSAENHSQPIYLGHPLYDREATIIHHFAFFRDPRWFPYPLLRAGLVFSGTLLRRLGHILADRNEAHRQTRSDFSIDAAHELARFIYDNVPPEWPERHLSRDSDVAGGAAFVAPLHLNEIQAEAEQPFAAKPKIIMKKAPYICRAAPRDMEGKEAAASCAMYARPMRDARTCSSRVGREGIYFAVKTCRKFHAERIPIIQSTWAPYASHVRYFSDVADDSVPTVSTGVPNVELGHCTKTLAILRLALKDIEQMNRSRRPRHHIHWLLLTDDDTLLSVSAVGEVLGCFDGLAEIYLGERYGYRLYAEDGFNYITGGGGIALSLPALRLVVQHCSCPSSSAPDDMTLGFCLNSLQIQAIHSPRFHQARPNDYPAELLREERPVSFHKFWQLDPIAVHRQWFADADRHLLDLERAAEPENQDLPSKFVVVERSLTHIPEPEILSAFHHSKERHIDL